MKKLADMLLSRDKFSELVIGNTALVRGMMEAGVRVVTSYPGSPTPEIAAAIGMIPVEQRPFYFEFSVNEKVATEVAFGASINGHLSCVFFKSVGLNVAADSFVQLSLMELIGGMVIILGDDPGANSSQNEQDNRHYAKLSYTPVLEPATPTEAYRMFLEAARLSREMRMPVILRLTTHVCHAKEKVSFDPLVETHPLVGKGFDIKNGPYIPLTSTAIEMKRRALSKLERVKVYADNCPFNTIVNNGNPGRGVITFGAPYLSLLDVLEDCSEKPDLLKLGLVNPLPRDLLRSFLEGHREVKILEELDDILEQEIKAFAYGIESRPRILGKMKHEDWIGEYTQEKVREVMHQTWPDLFDKDIIVQEQKPPYISPRVAQMCPGCGHRSAFYAIKKALKSSEITVADIGCHTLGTLEPYNMGQVLLSMGHSNGTAAGLSLFNTDRKVVAFIGDSTLFHAGLPGIVNSLFNKHNYTLIVMENDTTAMTGHQDHPGSGRNFNAETEKISIMKVLDGLGVKYIWEVDAYNQAKLQEYVEKAIHLPGFKVIIARHPCMLKFGRELRRKGGLSPRPVKIGPKCNRAYVCVGEFACPTFQLTETGEILVQKDLCIGDGSCRQTCPTGAIVSGDEKQGGPEKSA